MVEQCPIVTVVEVAEKLGFGHSTNHRHLYALGTDSKLGQLVPNKISVSNSPQKLHFLLSRVTRENLWND